MRVNRALAAGGLLTGIWLALPAVAQPMLVERILAVVDGRPVLLSEVRVVEEVTGVDRAQALEALIDERLMFREAARLPQAAVSGDEEALALQSLLARAGQAVADLSEGDLRQLARRQATILKYVEFRFRPQVRVDEDGAPEARTQLAEDDLRQRIEAWVKELRRASDVRYNARAPASSVRRGS
ncbi:MAG TPA: hypothetical protein VMT87_08040 [Vicinamibacteria bacterium]|nr:hypothetical protein [Vicinamibacteria bacterium]